MSLEYEVWCEEEPEFPRFVRVTTLIMRSVFMLGQYENSCTVDERGMARIDWCDSAFCLASKMGPEFAEVPGRWTLPAEAGSRGGEVHELLSIAVVVSAGIVHSGVVVDETGRLGARNISPLDILARVAGPDAVGGRELLDRLRVD